MSPFGLLLDKLMVPCLHKINPLGHEQWCKSELLSLIYHSLFSLELLNIEQNVEIVKADIDACFESIQTLCEVSVTISCIKRT